LLGKELTALILRVTLAPNVTRQQDVSYFCHAKTATHAKIVLKMSKIRESAKDVGAK
jgi:hypothetical protein